MRIKDKIAFDIIEYYKKLKGNNAFVKVFIPYNTGVFEYRKIADAIRHSKATDKIYPVSINQLSYSKIVPYCVTGAGEVKEKTGLFKISFSNGDFLLLASWATGYGIKEVVDVILAGPANLIAVLAKKTVYAAERKGISTPKLGIFRAYQNVASPNPPILYEELKSLPVNKVIHPRVGELDGDIDHYFNNVKLFTRFRQSGLRKLILISEPGTGKSSMFYRIAQAHKNTKSCVFVTDITAAIHHLRLARKYKLPTIVFLEDADSSIGGDASGTVLNFLDGAATPRNPLGSLVLMSTNFPEKIEPRILLRPGRIDKIYHIDALRGEYAVACADIYFGKHFNVKKNAKAIEDIVNDMTGARIKELALSSMALASSSQRKLSIELITEVKESFSKKMSEAYQYAEANSFNKLIKKEKLGFGVF